MAKNPDGGLSYFSVPDVEIVAEPRQMQALVARAARDSQQALRIVGASAADLKSLHHPLQALPRDFKSISGTRII
jgi:hypothetical protein